MEEQTPGNGTVYYLRGDYLAAAQLRHRINQVGEQMERVEREIHQLEHARMALDHVQEILEEMRALAVQAAGSPDPAHRRRLNQAFQSLRGQLRQVVFRAGERGINLLEGHLGRTLEEILGAAGR